MLEARGVVVRYRPETEVLRGVGMAVHPGELAALAGPNGVGKSTLLKSLLGFVPLARGEVLVDDRTLASMTHRERASRIAYVPQLVARGFSMTVFDAVLMGRHAHLGWRLRDSDLAAVERWLHRLGLAHLASRDVECLSGGQRQKVWLARALVQEACYLLLDEPTSNLDLRYQLECMDTLVRIAREDQRGVLVALHDLNLISRYADRVFLLHQGTVIGAGPPSEVLDRQAIETTYGVSVTITRENGHRHIVALQPLPMNGRTEV